MNDGHHQKWRTNEHRMNKLLTRAPQHQYQTHQHQYTMSTHCTAEAHMICHVVACDLMHWYPRTGLTLSGQDARLDLDRWRAFASIVTNQATMHAIVRTYQIVARNTTPLDALL
jgi:hypothetical protein